MVKFQTSAKIMMEAVLMDTQHYQLRISGLTEDSGKIKATTLTGVVEALRKVAETTVLLLATGTGSSKGAKPKWLKEVTDFVITDLSSCSTILGLEAPKLKYAAHDQFAQDKMFGRQTNLEDTSLDLVAASIKETQMESPVGEYFDTSVMEAIKEFSKVAGTTAVYQLTPEGCAHGEFLLDSKEFSVISEKQQNIPNPHTTIISGTLDEIKYGNGYFCLLMDEKTLINGRLNLDLEGVETLRHLWGKPATARGKIFFKASGQARFIEAEKIWAKEKGDDIFKKMPSAPKTISETLFELERSQDKAFDIQKLVGTWPGDESIEELLAELD